MESNDSSESEESAEDSQSAASGSSRVKTKAQPMTPFDKEILMEGVKKYHLILENKETDFGSRRKKDEAWTKISETYSSTLGISGPRTVNQLKKSWENSKRVAKKSVSKYKRQVRGTGGGPQPKQPSANTIKITSLIPDQMNPLPNPFDSDANIDHNVDFRLHEDEPFPSTSANSNKADIEPLTDTLATPRTTTSTHKRKYQDVRNSLTDMEYEEHKIRLKILVEDFETSRLKRMCAAEKLKTAEWNSKLAHIQFISTSGTQKNILDPSN